VPKTWVIHSHGMHLHRGRPRRWLPMGKSQFFLMHGSYQFGLQAIWRKGICVMSRCRRDLRYGTDRGEVKWEYPSMRKKVSKVSEGQPVKHLAPVETSLFAGMMPLVEHCCFRQYDDGDPREPGWITIKTQGAAWCVQVKDPDAGVSFTAIGETLDKALETAALLLACDDAPWEEDRWLKQQKAQKGKK